MFSSLKRNQAKEMLDNMSHAVFQEAVKKLDVYIQDWQKRHREEFGKRLEGWEAELRKSIRAIIIDEYDKFKENNKSD